MGNTQNGPFAYTTTPVLKKSQRELDLEKENKNLEKENNDLEKENKDLKNKINQKEHEQIKEAVPFKEYYVQTMNTLARSHKHKTVLSGKEFKLLFGNGNIFVRWMNKDMKHYNFQYVEGLNVDTVPFNPSGNCEGGGLYFTTIDHIKDHMSPQRHIRLVEIPDDSQVYHIRGDNKWKADKIIIKEQLTDQFMKLFNLLNC